MQAQIDTVQFVTAVIGVVGALLALIGMFIGHSRYLAERSSTSRRRPTTSKPSRWRLIRRWKWAFRYNGPRESDFPAWHRSEIPSARAVMARVSPSSLSEGAETLRKTMERRKQEYEVPAENADVTRLDTNAAYATFMRYNNLNPRRAHSLIDQMTPEEVRNLSLLDYASMREKLLEASRRMDVDD